MSQITFNNDMQGHAVEKSGDAQRCQLRGRLRFVVVHSPFKRLYFNVELRRWTRH